MSGQTWALVDHACRFCGSRILVDHTVYRCASCGVVSHGLPDGICGCGLNLPTKKRSKAGKLYHCGPNPRRSPDSPTEIVILGGDDEPVST